MGTFLVFFTIFCFSVGILTWLFAFALFFQKKGAIEKSFLLFLTVFLVLMFLAALIFNIEPEVITIPVLNFSLQLTSRLFAVLLLITLTNFTQRLVGKARSKRAKVVFYTASAAVFVGTALYHLLAAQSSEFSTMRQVSLPDLLLYVGGVYSVILIVKYYRDIESEPLRGVVHSFGIAILILFPFTVLDEFNLKLTIDPGIITPVEIQFLFFPFTYLIFNLMLLYHGFRHYIRNMERSNAGVPLKITDKFIQKYSITGREQELVLLLIEGYSNQQIGEKLFISTATVRNHLHNIFEKTGVRSRTELVKIAVQG